SLLTCLPCDSRTSFTTLRAMASETYSEPSLSSASDDNAVVTTPARGSRSGRPPPDVNGGSFSTPHGRGMKRKECAMFELMIRLSELTLPVFIYAAMLNVGMTQDPWRIIGYWKDWRFYLKMLAANFVVAPALMWLLLQFWPLRPEYMAGLFVFSMCAGAPFLIKLTATAE